MFGNKVREWASDAGTPWTNWNSETLRVWDLTELTLTELDEE